MSIDIAAELAAGETLLKRLPRIVEFALVGSAIYIPADAVEDVDFAVMLSLDEGKCAVDYASEMLAEWSACGEYDGVGGNWCAVRAGNLNLMLTNDRAFFDGYKLAMEVCKVLRLSNKDDRIAVCQVVRDKKKADEVRPPALAGVA